MNITLIQSDLANMIFHLNVMSKKHSQGDEIELRAYGGPEKEQTL
ncbi:hypothetical protein [Falsibacillus pallidus]|uniref:Uncharacterized protein n=1 Tax=Falsibacillus pallidus TaxID=493781 RepID=A0A370GWG0_9BACI|nr:hypothetical protein [Falsibacillus pallidus]RDI48025.1 hypothetical protein DFR59_101694 [Falsibacillus pallidus]